MKLIMENWRRHLAEAQTDDPCAEEFEARVIKIIRTIYKKNTGLAMSPGRVNSENGVLYVKITPRPGGAKFWDGFVKEVEEDGHLEQPVCNGKIEIVKKFKTSHPRFPEVRAFVLRQSQTEKPQIKKPQAENPLAIEPASQVVDHGGFPDVEEETPLLKIKDREEYYKRLYELVENVLLQTYRVAGRAVWSLGAAKAGETLWKIPLTVKPGMGEFMNDSVVEFREKLGLAGKPARPRVLRQLEILKKEGFAICQTGKDYAEREGCWKKNNSLGLSSCLVDIRDPGRGNWRIRVILVAHPAAAWRDRKADSIDW